MRFSNTCNAYGAILSAALPDQSTTTEHTYRMESVMQAGRDLLTEVSSKVATLFAPQLSFHQQFALLMQQYAAEKTFKGTEYVGTIGELYAKLLFGGVLVDESHEHDLVDLDGARLSVKTRRGRRRGWAKSGALPSIDSENGPTGLVFVNLNDDYTPRKIWRYDWQYLTQNGRFKEHVVRDSHRSFVFFVNESKDADFVCFPVEEAGQKIYSFSDLFSALYRDLKPDEGPHWSSNPVLTGALDRFGERMQNGQHELTLDLREVQSYIYDGGSPAYELMEGMHSVWRDESMEGAKGAPRLVFALLQLLSEHSAANRGTGGAAEFRDSQTPAL